MFKDPRTIYWMCGFAALLTAVIFLSDILLPFVAGVILAYLFDPLTDWLESHKLSRWLAAGLITLIAAVGVVSILLLLVPLLQSQFIDFANRLPNYIELLRGQTVAFLMLIQSQLSTDEITTIKQNISGAAGPNTLVWIGQLMTKLWGGGVALLNILSLLVITPIVTFYMLRDWDNIVKTVDSWIPRSQHSIICEMAAEIDRVLSGFLRGQLSVCLLLGIFYAVGLSAVGHDFGLIIGFFTGLISFVPYFGMLVGFAVGLGVSLAQFTDWQSIAMVIGVFAVGQFLEGSFFTPKLVGDRIGVHPVWIIFALLAGGTIGGFTGMLLAVPVAAIAGVISRILIQIYQKSEIYLGSHTNRSQIKNTDESENGVR